MYRAVIPVWFDTNILLLKMFQFLRKIRVGREFFFSDIFVYYILGNM